MITRAPSRWLAALAVLLLTGWLAVSGASVARAESADVFDRFDLVANVTADGIVEVTETITLRFGSSSGRHGLERTLITREPDGEEFDVVYRVTDVAVTSEAGVSSRLDLSDQQAEEDSARTTYLRIRVGDPDETITADSATYVLTYRVAGLLRSSGGYDELYWDLTGSSMPPIRAATARITVPGGAQNVFCSVATPGSYGACASAEAGKDGIAEFAAQNIRKGQLLTVSVQIKPGLLTNNTPIRVENADLENRRLGAYAFGGSVAAAALVPFIGWFYLRRRSSDRRFDGLPPGVLPAPGQEAREVRNDPRLEIPVSFAPPRLSVAEAGLLLDGRTETRDTTATLVALAVAGAIRLSSENGPQATLVDRGRAPDESSRILLKSLFSKKADPGESLDLAGSTRLAKGHEKLGSAALEAARAGGWYAREPAVGGSSSFRLGGLFFPVLTGIIVGSVFFGAGLLLIAPLLLAVVITVAVVRSKLKPGQRSGVGRALTDQVEGFRTYLATAEAEQLQFEEGEDIFSKYLPWAIIFDLTDRWTRVCQRLVELGRIPDITPAWFYGGTWDPYTFSSQVNTFDSSVSSSIAAAAPSLADTGFSSSGSAFSSSSSGGGFSSGGGGFSGGGGGGGGGGSW